MNTNIQNELKVYETTQACIIMVIRKSTEAWKNSQYFNLKMMFYDIMI